MCCFLFGFSHHHFCPLYGLLEVSALQSLAGAADTVSFGYQMSIPIK
jgi:hypothetical protein